MATQNRDSEIYAAKMYSKLMKTSGQMVEGSGALPFTFQSKILFIAPIKAH